MKVVTVSGLCKDYNGLRAVSMVDFEIVRGECYGFLGPNGAGKTTVMGILYCFVRATQGSVRVLGMDPREKPSEIKARLGVMPQEDSLDVDLSSLENLVVYGRYFGMSGKEASARAGELLDYVDLRAKADVNVRNLSGGMKRSLLLARSLMNRPEILILDEPTTGLDPHNRHDVWDKLQSLKEQGTTLILTTHYMEEADALCDRVAIMDSGKIIVIDTPERLKGIHGGNLEDVYLKLTGRRLES